MRICRPLLLAALMAATLATSRAAAETPIKLKLDTPFLGPTALFLVPFDKGYYKAEGLKVSIDPGTNSRDTNASVASGVYEIGFAGINAMIRYRDANPAAPVKAIFMIHNKPAYAIIGRKSRGIATPKDLEGKRLGAPANDSSFDAWPIFARVNDIDTSKVAIENISMPVREPMLAAGQVDAVTGLSLTTFVDLKDRGVPPDDLVVLLMADYGVTLYGNSVIVNTTFATEHPEAVRGFLNALLRGIKDVVKQPAGALDSVLRRNDGARKDVELERLTMAIRDNILTPEVKANGYGGIDNDRMARAIDQLALSYKFHGPIGDQFIGAQFLQRAIEMRHAQAQRVGHHLLRERHSETIGFGAADRQQTGVQLQQKMRHAFDRRATADIDNVLGIGGRLLHAEPGQRQGELRTPIAKLDVGIERADVHAQVGGRDHRIDRTLVEAAGHADDVAG